MNDTLSALLLGAFATGLAGSAHCLGMCGGIGVTLGLSGKKFLPAYHGGRLLSYSLLGLFLGAVLPASGLQAGSVWPRILAAVFMLATAAGLLLDRRPMAFLERPARHLWKPVAALTRHFIPTRTASDALILGLLWGFLPCGLIYSAFALALSSAHPLPAALIMLIFGIGTLPAMLAAGIFGGALAPWLKRSRVWLALIIAACAWWTASPFFH